MGHPLAKLTQAVDWRFLEERFGAVYSDGSGQPPLPARLMAGLAILKHMHDLSHEVLCERWIENPYYQLCSREGVVMSVRIASRSNGDPIIPIARETAILAIAIALLTIAAIFAVCAVSLWIDAPGA